MHCASLLCKWVLSNERHFTQDTSTLWDGVQCTCVQKVTDIILLLAMHVHYTWAVHQYHMRVMKFLLCLCIESCEQKAAACIVNTCAHGDMVRLYPSLMCLGCEHVQSDTHNYWPVFVCMYITVDVQWCTTCIYVHDYTSSLLEYHFLVVTTGLTIIIVLIVSSWQPCTIVEFIICGFGALAVSGMACFHTNLIATMKTTNEDVCTCT